MRERSNPVVPIVKGLLFLLWPLLVVPVGLSVAGLYPMAEFFVGSVVWMGWLFFVVAPMVAFQ